MSYKDHRPALKISTLPVSRVDFLPRTDRLWFACPRCSRWCGLHKGAIATHRAADNVTRCKASGRKVEVDVSATEHRRLRALAVAEAAQRRPVYSNRRAHTEPRTPIPAPLTGRRTPTAGQTVGWTGREAVFAEAHETRWTDGPAAARGVLDVDGRDVHARNHVTHADPGATWNSARRIVRAARAA